MPRIVTQFSDALGNGLARVFHDAINANGAIGDLCYTEFREDNPPEAPTMKRCFKLINWPGNPLHGKKCRHKLIADPSTFAYHCSRKWPCGRPMHTTTSQEIIEREGGITQTEYALGVRVQRAAMEAELNALQNQRIDSAQLAQTPMFRPGTAYGNTNTYVSNNTSGALTPRHLEDAIQAMRQFRNNPPDLDLSDHNSWYLTDESQRNLLGGLQQAVIQNENQAVQREAAIRIEQLHRQGIAARHRNRQR